MHLQMLLQGCGVVFAFARTAAIMGAQCCVHGLRTIPELKTMAPELIGAADPLLWFLYLSLLVCLAADATEAWKRVSEFARYRHDVRRAKRQKNDAGETR